MSHTLSVLVDNQPGVMARVSSLFARRGFNIHSLAVGPTHEPGISRITLVVNAPELEQLSKQLNKLVNVIKITELDPGAAIEREIMLVRVSAPREQRGEIRDTASIFDAKVVDVGVNSLTFEVVGAPAVLADFLELMRPYGVTELVKSGRIAVAKDAKARSLQATA